jgi:hypothetical protein
MKSVAIGGGESDEVNVRKPSGLPEWILNWLKMASWRSSTSEEEEEEEVGGYNEDMKMTKRKRKEDILKEIPDSQGFGSAVCDFSNCERFEISALCLRRLQKKAAAWRKKEKFRKMIFFKNRNQSLPTPLSSESQAI